MGNPTELAEYVAFAEALAREAGAYARNQFMHSPARRKADGSLLTATDEAIDRLIARRIQDRYPDHAVLSEEQVTHYDPGRAHTWVVDPIDGTTNFARNMSIWGTSIALLQEGEPVVGALYFPLLEECFTAARGAGAFRNREPIRASTKSRPDDQDLLIRDTDTWKHLQVDLESKIRVLGSAAYHWAKVADGTGIGALEVTVKVWDMAAAYVILEEAGGLARQLDRTPLFPLPPEAADYGRRAYAALAAGNSSMWECIRAAVSWLPTP